VTTLSQLEVRLATKLRDSANATWSTAELDDLINAGIDAVSDVRPREIVQTVGTVSANVFTYDASAFDRIYRLDIFSSAGSYLGSFEHMFGDSRDGGWETHGGVLYMPINIPLATGYTLQAFGYGPHIQLSTGSSTTDMSVAEINAMLIFAQAEAMTGLVTDRAKYQQFQANSNATDATLLGVAQAASALQARWQRERQRLRRVRKS